ncbi:SGNH/GDSL hydrolase family protein [Streptomyces sp. NP-1717]|uniref:SGNH/GDSL hydrolase family protein n=1 Tax=Streptomyces sp. NP-1717 TaxID=2704470 RepID=UPI001F5E2D17|nr:SGNH/GDSL hydrolase family protein [Streptomyces sp. NP-1717]MCI3226045.1 SGNH/GDSL hydrolase family protein [Streptomyces sp. NP-1717]
MDLTMQAESLVAVGDSLSEGVGDPCRGGALRGWIHYLTSEPPGRPGTVAVPVPGPVLVANLARSGTTVATLRRDQLGPAVALAPSYITCVIGVNDVIAARFDVASFEEDYAHVLAELSAAATVGVLTMTLHDVAAALPLSRARRARLRHRIAEANEVIERVSRRHGAWLLDAGAAARSDGAGIVCVDRLHPNRRGHRYLAALAGDVLRARGGAAPGPGAAVPAADPPHERVASAARHLLWLVRHLVPPLAGPLFTARRAGRVRASAPPADRRY